MPITTKIQAECLFPVIRQDLVPPVFPLLVVVTAYVLRVGSCTRVRGRADTYTVRGEEGA